MISLNDIPQYFGSAKYEICIGGGRITPWYMEHETEGGYDVNPDFQRGHVWTDTLRSAFITHLLRGGMHGRTLVWNSPTYDAIARKEGRDLPDTLVLVDGKQRLTAIQKFLTDEVTVWKGHRFSDFDEASQRDMLNITGALRMFMHVHALQRRHELLELYLQMNEGAVAHAPEELERVRKLRDEALQAS